MTVEHRVRTCRLVEKMQVQKKYTERLGLKNVSTFHEKQYLNVQNKEEIK